MKLSDDLQDVNINLVNQIKSDKPEKYSDDGIDGKADINKIRNKNDLSKQEFAWFVACYKPYDFEEGCLTCCLLWVIWLMIYDKIL